MSANPAMAAAGASGGRPPGAFHEPDASHRPDPSRELAGAQAPGAAKRSRRRLALVCVAVVLVFAALSLLGAFAAQPGGPASSSYSTGAEGVAAWATLLARSGRSVSQLRVPLSRARLSPDETLILLEPDALLRSDGARLMAFVRAGGRLLYGSGEPHTLVALLYEPPSWSAGAPTRWFGRSAAVAAAGSRLEVRSAGEGAGR